MKYTIKTSTFAKADRQNITHYLSQYSTIAPIKFQQELKKYIEIIQQTPHIFSEYIPDRNYRHVVIFGSYTIFYRINETDKTVFLYRILHGAQDIGNIL